ncbi:hypothetical protein FOZ62_012724 [Perkinsus olseni]|uniref:Uncharacterized protein n=1 Tax=Perkinsus olseni TaxID=32597 RepID=A0A7J6PVJ8_PEROL|nr:hypothetical protein FOZ62_012724 [Perkinsus olseni]
MPVYSATEQLPGPLSPKGIFKSGLVLMHRIRDSRKHPLLCLTLAGSVWALWLHEALDADLIPSPNAWTTTQECMECIRGQIDSVDDLQRAAMPGFRALIISNGALSFVQAVMLTLMLEIIGYTWELRVGTVRATLSAVVVAATGFAVMHVMDLNDISTCKEPLRYGRVEGSLPLAVARTDVDSVMHSVTVLLASEHIRISSDMLPRELRLGFRVAPEWHCWLLFIVATWQLSTVSLVRIYTPWLVAGLLLVLCDLSRLKAFFGKLRDSKIRQSLKHIAVLAVAIGYCPFTFVAWPAFDDGSEQLLGGEDLLGPLIFKTIVLGSLAMLMSGRTSNDSPGDLFYYIGGICVLVLTFYVMNSPVFVFPHLGLVLLVLECYSALTTTRL